MRNKENINCYNIKQYKVIQSKIYLYYGSVVLCVTEAINTAFLVISCHVISVELHN
jgi:hypothetical protein